MTRGASRQRWPGWAHRPISNFKVSLPRGLCCLLVPVGSGRGRGRTKTNMGGEKSLCPQGNDCTFPGPAQHPGWLLWGWVSLLGRHWRIWASGSRGSEDRLEENCSGILGQEPHTKVPGYPLPRSALLTPCPHSLPWQHQAYPAVTDGRLTPDLALTFSCFGFLVF